MFARLSLIALATAFGIGAGMLVSAGLTGACACAAPMPNAVASAISERRANICASLCWAGLYRPGEGSHKGGETQGAKLAKNRGACSRAAPMPASDAEIPTATTAAAKLRMKLRRVIL